MTPTARHVVTVEREGEFNAARQSAGRPGFDYSLYGLHLHSDIDLPIAGLPDDANDLPLVNCLDGGPLQTAPNADGVVTCELRCPCPAHAGQVVMRVHHGPERIRVWNDIAGICDIAQDGRSVVVYPCVEQDPERRMLAHLLTGIVSTLLLFQRLGAASLHASGVVVDGRAALFLGPKGQGKSTMAAAFLRRGAELLTDDLLPLRERVDGIYGLPGVPLMKLWDESVEHALAYAGEHLPPVVPNFPKKFIPISLLYPLASEPVRLAALYVLDRYDPEVTGRRDVTIAPLKSGDGLMAVLAQTPLRGYLPPKAFAPLLPQLTRLVGQAGVRVVSFPSGYPYQDYVHDRIRADLRGKR